MAEDGIGLLYQEFLELKEKLFKEGLFDQKYKKPLPNYPKVVAVITSPTGDAVRDIISTFNRRLPLAKIIVYPALVQGKDAPSDLVRALKQVYNDNLKRRFCALHDFKLIEVPYTEENLISYDYLMAKAGY